MLTTVPVAGSRTCISPAPGPLKAQVMSSFGPCRVLLPAPPSIRPLSDSPVVTTKLSARLPPVAFSMPEKRVLRASRPVTKPGSSGSSGASERISSTPASAPPRVQALRRAAGATRVSVPLPPSSWPCSAPLSPNTKLSSPLRVTRFSAPWKLSSPVLPAFRPVMAQVLPVPSGPVRVSVSSPALISTGMGSSSATRTLSLPAPVFSTMLVTPAVVVPKVCNRPLTVRSTMTPLALTPPLSSLSAMTTVSLPDTLPSSDSCPPLNEPAGSPDSSSRGSSASSRCAWRRRPAAAWAGRGWRIQWDMPPKARRSVRAIKVGTGPVDTVDWARFMGESSLLSPRLVEPQAAPGLRRVLAYPAF